MILVVCLWGLRHTFDDFTDDVSDYVRDYVIYCQSSCSIVHYCHMGMWGMYCARSRDRCHALLRNSDVINLEDNRSVCQNLKKLRLG